MNASSGRARSPIVDALNAGAYHFLSMAAPDLLTAIEREVAGGKSPEQIRRIIVQHIGPEREALALRAYQAAQHIAQTQRN